MFFREFPTVSLLPVRHHDACELWGKIDVSNRRAIRPYTIIPLKWRVAYSRTHYSTEVFVARSPHHGAAEQGGAIMNKAVMSFRSC
jgi:hypothetical protein